jgi:hypothetical protein
MKKNQIWRLNLEQFAKIKRLGTLLKLSKAKLVQFRVLIERN